MTRVLISGAGPVGLALAIELGLQGIECLVVERRKERLKVPRMSAVSSRNMEFCRYWGIADKVRHAVWSSEHPMDFVYVETMTGRELARLRIPSYREQKGRLDYSPEGTVTCPQIYFDPILAELAQSLDAVTLEYGTRLKSFTQHEDRVTSVLSDSATGGTRTIESDYLVGCDGAGGLVRPALDIALEGAGAIASSVNVFFRSTEFPEMHDKGWARFYRFFDENGCWGEVIAIDGKELWRLSVFDDPQPDLTGRSYLRKLGGREFSWEILDVSPWERRDCVARTYGQGRVFIAGDAAHEASPTGGAGMHIGICDTVNLAWKIRAVLDGWGGTRLLGSYEAESRPIALRFVRLSTLTFDALKGLPGASVFQSAFAADPSILHALTIPDQLRAQFTYENSPICVSDGTPPPEGAKELLPSARPGTRAPHVWLRDGRSMLDLFGRTFILIRFDRVDVTPLLRAAAAVTVPLDLIDIEDTDAARIYECRLVLVRPDGHVAWRADTLPRDCGALIDRVRGAGSPPQ